MGLLLFCSTNVFFMMRMIRTIQTRLKRVYDRIQNERFKTNLLQAIPFWIASVITGLLAVLYARLFALAEHGTAYILHHKAWLLFLIMPAGFIMAWWPTWSTGTHFTIT
jgi:hypothetical protein